MSGRIERAGVEKWLLTVELGRDAKGIRRRKRITFYGGERAARKELARLTTEVEDGKHLTGEKLTVGQFLARWLETYAKPNTAVSTFAEYEKIIRTHLTPHLGRTALSKLLPIQLQQYYTYALTNGRKDGRGGLSPRTVLHHHRLLHQAFRHAVRWGLLRTNPADQVDPPSPEEYEASVTDEAGLVLLFEALRDHWLYLPVLISASTSLRRGEVLGFRWSDVDWKSGVIHLRRSLEEIPGGGVRMKGLKTKRKGRRGIDLPPFVVEELAAARERAERQAVKFGKRWQGGPVAEALICSWEDGSPLLPDSVTHAFGRVSRELGLGLRFHDLRHSHITSLLAAGEQIKLVSDRAGHSTSRLTLDTYGHALPGQGRGVAERFGERVEEARRRLRGTNSAQSPPLSEGEDGLSMPENEQG